ncbi:MAG: acyl-CoA dehydrogenase family protein [Oligoflexia bacterium]|nr:acyl-CoA dehydrogenase family protein [Oligoflexia bacterium]
MSDFFQQGPQLENQFLSDRVLRSLLKRKIPAQFLPEVEADLTHFGERVVTDILEMGQEAEAQPPRLVPIDPWGKRIDQIETSRAWKELDRVSAKEGIVALGYERPIGEYSRLYQFAKLYLFHPSSAIYSCPLAMTDGAARVIELMGDADLKANAFRHLTSRDPDKFWTSGQWMTEKTGGSDVSNTETIARPDGNGFRLYGTKWFTSAVSAQMSMALARIEGAPAGNKGLSLFYVELRDAKGQLDHIRVQRLKDKLGTKALPTAELILEGLPAKLVGGPGDGVKKIASLFNVTRVYNSVCAIGYMRRGLALAQDYAPRRIAFGKPLSEHPLHLETLANMQMDFESSFHLTFYVAELLGKDELGKATPEESACLRLLMPVTKLYTAKIGVALASEMVESFGGAGYVEDTGIPVILRNAQVLAIWEGTTNVLSLDMLRAIDKESAFAPFIALCRRRLDKITKAELVPSVLRARDALARVEKFLPLVAAAGGDALQASARVFAMAAARVCAATLMLEHAEWEKNGWAFASATRWCAGDLTPGLTPEHFVDPVRLQEARSVGLNSTS